MEILTWGYTWCQDTAPRYFKKVTVDFSRTPVLTTWTCSIAISILGNAWSITQISHVRCDFAPVRQNTAPRWAEPHRKHPPPIATCSSIRCAHYESHPPTPSVVTFPHVQTALLHHFTAPYRLRPCWRPRLQANIGRFKVTHRRYCRSVRIWALTCRTVPPFY